MDILKRLLKYIFRFPKQVYYKSIFKNYSFHSCIMNPLRIDGAKNISIGKNVIIQYKTWLAAMPLTETKNPELIIDDGTTIGHFNHIYATKYIHIEENVLIADNVYISDNLHGYENINIPIVKQPIIQNKEVIIGSGSWLGENVCVLGAKIGKHCVIGANSVVTKDIPDYSVAVGIPVKVIKRYNKWNKQWEKIE